MPESVSQRIAWARTQKGWTARGLSRRANLSDTHVSLLESRDGGVSGETLRKIAKALDVSVDWLLSGAGPRPELTSKGTEKRTGTGG